MYYLLPTPLSLLPHTGSQHSQSVFSGKKHPAAENTVLFPETFKTWASLGPEIFSALASLDKVPSQTWDELGPVWESRCLVQVGGPSQPRGFIWAPAGKCTLKRCPRPGSSLVLVLRLLGREALRIFSCIMVFPLQPLRLLLVHPSNRSQRDFKFLFFFVNVLLELNVLQATAHSFVHWQIHFLKVHTCVLGPRISCRTWPVPLGPVPFPAPLGLLIA